MDDLIEKLEAAKEGSRELDLEIAAEVSPESENAYEFNERILEHLPHYTTSLDAALTLVPEGWALVDLGENGVWGLNGKAVPWLAVIHKRGIRETNDDKEGWASSPSLALCIAALKARND